MQAFDLLTLTLLCLLLGAHYKWAPVFARHNSLITTAMVGSIAVAIIITGLTHFYAASWSPAPINFTVPPYVPLPLYLKTLWLQIAAPYTLSLILALIAYKLFTCLNFFKTRLYNHEAFYIAATIFLMRHPYWLPYVISLCLLALIAALHGTLTKGSSYRFSLYTLWLPSGIITILLIPFLQSITWFHTIGFPNLY